MHRLILLFITLLSAVNVGSACTDTATASSPAARIAVIFVQPQHLVLTR